MRVTAENKGNLLMEARCGNHSLLLDVPKTWGGKDRGPNPTELFAASLAACVVALVTKACVGKGLDAKGTHVEVTYDYMQDPLRMDNFRVRIRLPHGIGAEHRADLQKAAESCPVHETMRGRPNVQFSFE
jgi:putative redox protein